MSFATANLALGLLDEKHQHQTYYDCLFAMLHHYCFLPFSLPSLLIGFLANEAKLLFYFSYNSTWFTKNINGSFESEREHTKFRVQQEDKRPSSSHQQFANFISTFFLSFFLSPFASDSPARLSARNYTKKTKRNPTSTRSSITFSSPLFFRSRFLRVLAKFKLTCDFFYGLI